MSRFAPTRTIGRQLAGGAIALCLTAVAGTAHAHFQLMSPESWAEQDLMGSPQKMGPCGNEGNPTPTNAVTPYQAGETIMITIDEKVTHPGHYRVALAVNDASELPAEPPVTAGATACGSVPVQDPAVFPVLADGMLEHTMAFSGPQTIAVTLPSDVTCDHCTLQVIEFMSSHAAPCFYHHCAIISIGGASGAGGMSAGGASGAGGQSGGDGGAATAGAGAGGAGAGGAGDGGQGGLGGGGLGGTGVDIGGIGGMSGASGQGGIAAGGGVSTGGTIGAGVGGSAGTAGSSGTAPLGSGGAVTGGSSGSGSTAAPATADDQAGCGCRVAGARQSSRLAFFGALALGGFVVGRRRTARRRRRAQR